MNISYETFIQLISLARHEMGDVVSILDECLPHPNAGQQLDVSEVIDCVLIAEIIVWDKHAGWVVIESDQ